MEHSPSTLAIWTDIRWEELQSLTREQIRAQKNWIYIFTLVGGTMFSDGVIIIPISNIYLLLFHTVGRVFFFCLIDFIITIWDS